MPRKVEKYEGLLIRYLDDVRSGKRIAGRLERSAVKRFDSDRERERSDPDYPYELNMQLAETACEFFELFKHTDGEYAGRRFELYPWQVFIVFNLFGWVHKSTGFRRYREAFLSVGRGNGKSPFGALIMLLLFAFDAPLEARAEVYTSAVKRDQAKIAFGACKRFVETTPLKDGYISIFQNKLSIDRTNSIFEPLSSDAKSADGLNIHGLLRDELHAWTEKQRDYYEKLQTALGKRRQPLAVTITTAGDEESQIWREEHGFASKVVDPDCPVESDSLFVMIFEIDDDDSELEEDNWHKANPMLEFGVVKVQYLKDLAAKAETEPAALNQFRRYHCNKLTVSANRSITSEMWAKGAADIPWEMVKEIYSGVDLGWKDDLAAVGYVAPLDWVSIEGKSKRRYAVWADVFVPAGSARDLNRQPFAEWINSGRLIKTDSEWTDTTPIYKSVDEANKRFGIKSLAYDPAGAREFALNCENELSVSTFAFSQQHKHYHEPLEEFVIAMNEGRLIHGDDSLLGWATLNVIEDVNSKGHRMPSKKRSEDKIDPFVAVLMAFSESLFSERQKPSVYETRGPLMLGDMASQNDG